ncbi:SMP-30/gluconolactonase/LRE family protein [Aureimonas psammosilenae]|uniref:SMP-30/gluconolactonase/LRE family protein n=1 Tax=Aureimonas psammosilenae TaxID=2495496 RepID=UPI0012605DB7
MVLKRRELIAGALSGAAVLPLMGGAMAQETGAGAEATEARPAGEMELFRLAAAPSTPTGIAVSAEGRVFVFMPRFNADVPYTVGEVAGDGSVTAYPDAETNRPDPSKPQSALFHVPNGVFGPDGKTLWLLDAALPDGSGPPVDGGAKLVEIDLATNKPTRVVPLGAGVAKTSSLNDLRVGRLDGINVAFVTDQGQDGEGAIIAVNLDSGAVLRRLAGHASTKSQEKLVKFVEHRPVMLQKGDAPPQAPKGGANGIALSPDGKRLYYAPLMGRHLYAASTDDLLIPGVSDDEIAAGVKDLGEKGMTGGLAADSKDRVYLALQEQNAVGRRSTDGTIEVIGSDSRLIWADTFSITPDGWLYINGAQVNRRPEYNRGQDLQKPPYAILRIKIDAGPA